LGHGKTGIADIARLARRAANPANSLISYIPTAESCSRGIPRRRNTIRGAGAAGGPQFLDGDSRAATLLDLSPAGRRVGLKLSKEVVIAGHSKAGQAACSRRHGAVVDAEAYRCAGDRLRPVTHLSEEVRSARALTPSPAVGLGIMMRGASTSPSRRLT